MDDLIELEALSDAAQRVLLARQDRNRLLKDPDWLAQREQSLLKISAELGWLGLCVPEQHGGLQQPFNALATLYVELGRALCGSTVSVATTGLALLSPAAMNPVVAELIEGILSGEKLALSVANGRMAVETLRRGTGYLLTGTVRGVPAATAATHLLIPLTAQESGVALVPIPHPSLSLKARTTWDITRGQLFDITFEQLEITDDMLILRNHAAEDALLRAAAHFDLFLACDAIGGSEQVLNDTLAYMQTRTQFGRAIASFQALKHRCADLATDIHAARALVNAACQADVDPATWRAQAAASRLLASAVYRRVSEEAVQLHGGIGFTWEQSCHLFLKRARFNDALGGTPEQRKDQAAPYMLAEAWRRKASA